ncbi:MAG: 2-oxo acid dehydrogenase subunit E2, partial [Clostridia bacterium]|nr:2-oxo acid dehydrogenase subunit E2 [Clostridia bacterium]
KRRGDRFDATLVRNLDPLHWFMPYIYPNRADNEAFIREEFDLTNLNAFLEKKNEGLDKAHRYTIFHAVSAAIVKAVTLRPQMNRFIQGRRLYQRDELSLGFVVKKQFRDNADEGLAFIKFPEDTTIDSLHERIMAEIFECRSDKMDNSTKGMEMFTHLPRWLMRIVMWVLHRLDFYGKVPYDLIKADPNYASVFLTNLGSIKLNAAYHHLSNWGTTSVFVIIGEKGRKPVFHEDGTFEMRDMLSVGITLDERIADGYYYAQTVRLVKKLIECPELLDLPANVPVEY